jgi:hypothetical protein
MLRRLETAMLLLIIAIMVAALVRLDLEATAPVITIQRRRLAPHYADEQRDDATHATWKS